MSVGFQAELNYPAVAHWPLILAGPVLRRTEPGAVTVWVAVQRPCRVRLTVHDQALETSLMAGEATTRSLGDFLHVVAVTARAQGRGPHGDGPLGPLLEHHIYPYSLHFITDAGEYSLAEATGSTTDALSYFEHGLPTLVLPPARWQDLQLIHGSCRKPHAHGYDALPFADGLLARTAADPKVRPQQLFLTGDQIYGDDVAEPMLWLAQHLGSGLLGWHEKLPNGSPAIFLAPGERTEAAEEAGGLTASVGKGDEKLSSHLFTLGEYVAAYLLAISPTCWPNAVTQPASAPAKQLQALEDFRGSLWQVRRALANIAVYTIFDDHDVSDDWYLNQQWCLQVLGQPLGRQVVRNALLAYAVVQHWGNVPEQFGPQQPGERLLAAMERWTAAEGKDDLAETLLARYLGLPEADPHTGLPRLRTDGEGWVLNAPAEGLTWHYHISGPGHEVIMLDTRTHRCFPVDDSPLAPPNLLSPTAMKDQVERRLEAVTPERLVFLVAPTNPFSLKIIDQVQKRQLGRNQVYSSDVGDAWNLPTNSLAQLLTAIFRRRQRLVILSGDIHLSYAVRLHFHSQDPQLHSGRLVQFTSSAIANEEPMTRAVHTRLKHWLLPEPQRHWIGHSAPAAMEEVTLREARRRQADWICSLEWMERQSAQTAGFGTLPWVRQRRRWLDWLKFWQQPWIQDGKEVVGRNNISLVYFQGEAACQDCYWYATWDERQAVYSHFEVPWED